MSITPRQDAILVALRDYHLLSSALVQKLLFGRGAITSAQTLLKGLFSTGYVLRKPIPRENQVHGKGFYVYGLAAKGRNFLAEQGRDIDPRFRPGDFDKLTNYTLHHTLEINAFLINLRLLARAHPIVRVAGVTHEQTLRRGPIPVVLASGAKARVVPDAWADLRIKGLDGVYQSSYLIEIDRGTRERRSFQEKIERLVALIPGPYEQAFQAPAAAVTVAFIATKGPKQAKELRAWIEQELTRLTMTSVAPLFSITPFDAAADEPDALFLSPRTLRPFTPTAFALIDLGGSGG
jgi:Replication-relaxation